MAIYHLSMKPVSRATGRSAVASMAYRAGEKLTNERDGITHDYTAKQGVEYAEIVLPGRQPRRLGAGSFGLVERRRVCREAEGRPRCPRI